MPPRDCLFRSSRTCVGTCTHLRVYPPTTPCLSSPSSRSAAESANDALLAQLMQEEEEQEAADLAEMRRLEIEADSSDLYDVLATHRKDIVKILRKQARILPNMRCVCITAVLVVHRVRKRLSVCFVTVYSVVICFFTPDVYSVVIAFFTPEMVLTRTCLVVVIHRFIENEHSRPGTPLYNRFVTAWERVADQTVLLAFHGTAEQNIDSICQTGLDPSLRRGQALGPGEYVTAMPLPRFHPMNGRGVGNRTSSSSSSSSGFGDDYVITLCCPSIVVLY